MVPPPASCPVNARVPNAVSKWRRSCSPADAERRVDVERPRQAHAHAVARRDLDRLGVRVGRVVELVEALLVARRVGVRLKPRPIQVLPAPFGTTWRICLSSNGPPLRTIITSPPSGVAAPVAPKASTISATAATAAITMFLTGFTPSEYPQ